MHSQRKGQRAETELANKLNGLGFFAERASAMYETGGNCPDVEGIPGVHIECKRTERLNLSAAMSQSAEDAHDDEVPVVMHRKNREGWLVTLRLDDIHRFVDTIPTKYEIKEA